MRGAGWVLLGLAACGDASGEASGGGSGASAASKAAVKMSSLSFSRGVSSISFHSMLGSLARATAKAGRTRGVSSMKIGLIGASGGWWSNHYEASTVPQTGAVVLPKYAKCRMDKPLVA